VAIADMMISRLVVDIVALIGALGIGELPQ